MVHLNYKKYGEGDPLIVLHGLFGSLDNWATLARQWSDTFTVYAVDLRNHGKSPHTSSHTINNMATDIQDFISEHNIKNPVLLGHSMGGKAAMETVLTHPDQIRGLIIADMGAQSYPRGHDEIFSAIRSLNLEEAESRKYIEEKLSDTIDDKGIVYFISKNISRTKEGYHWKMNIDTLERDYEEVLKAIRPGRIFDKPTLLLKGEKSNYVNEENINLLRQLFPRIKIEAIKDSGHWVHAENPDLFEQRVRSFMKSL